MLVSDWGSLKASLATYSFHSRLSASYDLLTANFERAANRRLRVRPMEMVANLTTVSGQCPIPTDYLLWRAVIWGTAPDPDNELGYTHPVYLNKKPLGAAQRLFTIEGNTFKTNPIDDTNGIYEFHYYQKIPTIIGSNDLATNWLITEHPDLYEYGVVYEAMKMQRNGDGAQAYKALRDEAFQEIIQLYALTTGAPAPIVRTETAEYF